jgi:PPM family protein phosphatase
MKIRPGVELAGISDVGCIRTNNEDSYCYWESEDDALFARLGRLAVVADGMGGYEGGQIASRLAVEVVRENYAGSLDSSTQQALLGAFAEAHRRIQRNASQSVALREMGTTCTAFALLKNKLYFAHVGDSRLYLLREGKLQRLTRDHTLIARWIENGAIRPEEAETHPQKHVLTAALGIAEDIQPHYSPAPLQVQPRDVLMLCTDGLWGQVSGEEIQEILGSQSPQESCRELVHRAINHGAPDNVTLQVLRIV